MTDTPAAGSVLGPPDKPVRAPEEASLLARILEPAQAGPTVMSWICPALSRSKPALFVISCMLQCGHVTLLCYAKL